MENYLSQDLLNKIDGKLKSSIPDDKLSKTILTNKKEAVEMLLKKDKTSLGLQERSTWIHQALFVVNNELLDIIINNINVIFMTAPYLLNHLSFLLIAKSKQTPDLIKLVHQENYLYEGYATRLLYLSETLDFVQARKDLQEAIETLDNDFLLRPFKDQFLENCRLNVFNIYCKIHSNVSVETISKLLILKSDPEKWIKNAVSLSGQQFKFENGNVSLNIVRISVYENVVKKTAVLESRAKAILQALG